jgi:hypothetical protein
MSFSFAVVVLQIHVRKKKTIFTFTLLLTEDFWNDECGLTFAPDIENNNIRANNKHAGENYVTG